MASKNLFLANNDTKALNMFKYRKLYQENVMGEISDKKIDFWYDISFYGKVDFHNRPVYISESNLKQLDSDQGTILALDFVADAFEDLQKYFRRAITTKRIKTTGAIAKMQPKKAWESTTTHHHVHMDYLFKNFVMSYLRSNIDENTVETLEDFLVEFLKFYDQMKNTFPITRSGFIKSRYCSPLTSGLVIEFDDKDKDDDRVKQKNILEDENYEFLKNAARRFGFFLDKNVPFRLVSDIMSSKTQEYMSAYGIDSSQLFSSYFYKAIDYDMSILRSYLIQMWNSYIASYPFSKEIRENCSGTKILTKIKKRDPAEEKFYDSYYDEAFWLDYYFRIRVKESLSEMQDDEIERKIKNAVDLYKKLDISSAFVYIDSELK